MRGITRHFPSQGRTTRPTAHVVAVAAFAWSLAFGLLNVFWAVGGTFGASTLSASIRELAMEAEPVFVATVWISGVGKIVGGLLPLALAFGWWRRIPRRWLRNLCGLGGVLLTLYGLGDMVRSALILLDIWRSGVVDEVRTAWWYLFFWGPVWFTGGALYGATALLNGSSGEQ